jgi:alginate O-acetyltransferase complex protein AlgI
MLFNSYGFIFLFLPVWLAAFTLANRVMGAKGGVLAIVLGSLIFYASWEPRFLLLLLPSVGLNDLAGRLINQIAVRHHRFC